MTLQDSDEKDDKSATRNTVGGDEGVGVASTDTTELQNGSHQNMIETLPAEVLARILEYSVFSDIFRMAKALPLVLSSAAPRMSFLYFDVKVKSAQEALNLLRYFEFDPPYQ